MTSHTRLSWAADQLDVQPDHHVLEVGCGHGVAATLFLDGLTSGRYVGLDRSAAMIAASERRNRGAVDSGRARFVCAPLDDADLAPGRFDRIFAARVAAMTGPPGLMFAARRLGHDGMLVLAFDSPQERRTGAQVYEVSRNLVAAGFRRPRIVEARIAGSLVACVSARLSEGGAVS